MLTPFQSIILGLVQGVTELFPISSLGHSVVLPRLLGWNINQNSSFFLTFLVATHAATALVLFIYFLLRFLLKTSILKACITGITGIIRISS